MFKKALLVSSLTLFLAGCHDSDKFSGTWKEDNDPDKFILVKEGDLYKETFGSFNGKPIIHMLHVGKDGNLYEILGFPPRYVYKDKNTIVLHSITGESVLHRIESSKK